YVLVYDLNGRNLAHGANAAMRGRDQIDTRDADGKYFVRERVELARERPSFWQDYKFWNPVTRQIELKSSYFERVDDLLVGCGFYKACAGRRTSRAAVLARGGSTRIPRAPPSPPRMPA